MQCTLALRPAVLMMQSYKHLDTGFMVGKYSDTAPALEMSQSSTSSVLAKRNMMYVYVKPGPKLYPGFDP